MKQQIAECVPNGESITITYGFDFMWFANGLTRADVLNGCVIDLAKRFDVAMRDRVTFQLAVSQIRAA